MNRSDYSWKYRRESDAVQEMIEKANRGWKIEPDYLKELSKKHNVRLQILKTALTVLNR